MMSMTRAFADQNAPVDVVFMHAARTPMDFVFRTELSSMARRMPGLRLVFIPERRDGEPEWPGAVGRISSALCQLLIEGVRERVVFAAVRLRLWPPPAQSAWSWVCRAPPTTRKASTFDPGGSGRDPRVRSLGRRGSLETCVQLRYSFVHQILPDPVSGVADKTVLTIARYNGLPIPSSCRNGVCGTCKSKLVSGTVDMKHNGGISTAGN